MYSEVIGIIHIFALDTVGSAYSPVLVVDGSTAEVEGAAEGEVLETKLVGKLSSSSFSTTYNPIQASSELRLGRWGGCIKKKKLSNTFQKSLRTCLICKICFLVSSICNFYTEANFY